MVQIVYFEISEVELVIYKEQAINLHVLLLKTFCSWYYHFFFKISSIFCIVYVIFILQNNFCRIFWKNKKIGKKIDMPWSIKLNVKKLM